MSWKVIFLTEGMVQKEQGVIITKVSYGRACINTALRKNETPIFYLFIIHMLMPLSAQTLWPSLSIP